ncbi:40299_t:CDS:1, partial [Gigaspora margarita]
MRHIDAYVCWFPSDFNDGHRIPSTDWESDYNREAVLLNAITPLLNPNNFPKALNIHYNHNATKPGQDIFGADWLLQTTHHEVNKYYSDYTWINYTLQAE